MGGAMSFGMVERIGSLEWKGLTVTGPFTVLLFCLGTFSSLRKQEVRRGDGSL